MTLHGELVLADDVLMTPAEDVAAHAGDGQLAFEPGDHVIGRAGSRTPAKLIDARAASLLEQFRAPRRVVEAIVTHSRDGGHDPHRTLEEALPLIQHFVAVGFLVRGDSGDARKITFSLEPGDRAGEFEIVDRVQALEDTEVYRARAGAEAVAVKLARGPGGERAVANERRILEQLDGTVDPGLVAAGDVGGRPYVATRWCAGASAAVAALQTRDRGDLTAVASLATSVLEAYAHLHDQGVVHGDVHPDNLVVAPDGAVTILDYGLARAVAEPTMLPPRGGVSGFADPGFAAARRGGFEPPPATFADEQYSLGVLTYMLVTGRPYMDLSLVEEEMVRQVLEEDPVAFAERGLEWPQAEAVIARALHKDGGHRYPDVRTFAHELRAAASTPPRVLATTRPTDVVDELVGHLADPEAAERALADGMWECSVNTGAAGVAYALHRLALLRDSPDLAAASEVWARHARRHARAAAARDDLSDELPPGARLDLSLFHRDPGIHCVLALVAHARGDRATYEEAVEGFLGTIEPEVDDVDLALGRAGVLLGCAHLLPAAESGSDTARRLLEAGERRRVAIWSQLGAGESIRGGGRVAYLGIAHGWGGIAYATLSWSEVTGTPIGPEVTERLDELAALGERAGAAATWWPRLAPLTASDYWTGWCNGAAGLAHLWELAGTLLGREDYLDLAERAATAGAEPSAGGDLCCGSAGSAYSLLRVHRRKNDPHLLATARRLADHAAATVGRERPHALYKGRLGVALLHAELEDPAAARMPLFEPEVWR